MSKKIVVIGGGPAGIEAAKGASMGDTAVTLISNAPIGGRAGWHSLLPSKVWLTVADTLGHFHEADEIGIANVPFVMPAPADVLTRLRQVKAGWNAQQAEALEALGVAAVMGTAVFTAPNRIEVRDKEGQRTAEMEADAFIVTSGSVPIFPPTMKPNGKRILAPRFASALKTLPDSIVVIGGGATGTEFAYLFNRLGVDVSWVVDAQGVLPDFDSKVGQALGKALAAQGVKQIAGQRATDVVDEGNRVLVTLANGDTLFADMAFLAVGRKPDVSGLNLESAGVAVDGGRVEVDGYGRSANPAIYLAGDVTGAPMIANRAMAQAWAAGRHAAGDKVSPFDEQLVMGAVYTEPQAAQIGHLNHTVVTLSYGAGMKGHLLPQSGFVKLGYESENGRLTGAAAVGHLAADLLAPVIVAMKGGMTIHELGSVYGAHPTLSELLFMAARLAS